MSGRWPEIKATLDGVVMPRRHTLFTVNGFMGDMFFGPQADVANGQDDELFYWQPIGYPNTQLPMGGNIAAGKAELVNQMHRNPGTWAWAIYSEGAVVGCEVWRDEILNPAGSLHDRLDQCIGIVTFGNPMRAQGVENGNVYAGWPLLGAQSGGIAGATCLQPDQIPSYWLDFAHKGDLYTDMPEGTGQASDETLIYNSVTSTGPAAKNVLRWFETVVSLLLPWKDVAAIKAIAAALGFFGKGTRPHVDYDPGPATGFIASQGHSIPPAAL